MIDNSYHTTLPPIYYERAARLARKAIVGGAILTLVYPAVFLFLLLAPDPEDRSYIMLFIVVVFTAAGVWSIHRGIVTLRNNKNDQKG